VPSLFISDLHLQIERPELTAVAMALFEHCPGEFDELFILGDLFEYWIGDDAEDDCARQTRKALRNLADNGVTIHMMHGNRDFLMGEAYVHGCGANLIADDSVALPLGEGQMLALHGDTLCTDDSEYQMYRRMVRNRHWQQEFLSRTLSERLATAKAMRDTSAARGRDANNRSISDVSPDAVASAVTQAGCRILLHGHTHRPASHTLDNDAVRLVLGDWSSKGAVVAVSDAAECRLVYWNGTSFEAYDA
jgi:UDP-2,3-diacylglucosamine hydrolase